MLRSSLKLSAPEVFMAVAKQKAIKLIQKMPDESTTSDIMAELYFKNKVEQGLMDVKNRKTISHATLKKKMTKWAKSVGH